MHPMTLDLYISAIVNESNRTGWRMGQTIYNTLHRNAQEIVNDTSADPFHWEMTRHEVRQWAIDHLVFDGWHNIIGIIVDDEIYEVPTGV